MSFRSQAVYVESCMSLCVGNRLHSTASGNQHSSWAELNTGTVFILPPTYYKEVLLLMYLCIYIIINKLWDMTPRFLHVSTENKVFIVWNQLILAQGRVKLDSAFRFTRCNVELKPTCYFTAFYAFFPKLLHT
jgi:hypothetical protein